MLRDLIRTTSNLVTNFINQPVKVLAVCTTLAFLGLVFDGTLFHLWALNRDSVELDRKTKMTLTNAKKLREKIHQANDPQFIELEAHERFDLAGEDELVFVFSEEK